MKQDEIIRFAIQCRLVTTGNRDGLYMDALTEFANLVAAKATAVEREKCAKKCKYIAQESDSFTESILRATATQIRARGEA